MQRSAGVGLLLLQYPEKAAGAAAEPAPLGRQGGGCLRPLLHLINDKASPVTSSLQSPMWDLALPGPRHSILPRLLKVPGGLLTTLPGWQ